MTVRIIVDSRVRVERKELSSETEEALKAEFAHDNPVYHRLRAMKVRFDHRLEPRKIETWQEEGEWLTFPRGGMNRVRTALGELPHAIRDMRTTGELRGSAGFTWTDRLSNPDGSERKPFEDQERVITACLKKQNCLIRSATGSGKTTSLLMLALQLRLPTIVVVWSSGLFEQWIRRIQDEAGIDARWIGRVRGKERVYGPITVGMQQTIFRIKDPKFFRMWGVYFQDEVHKSAARTFFQVADSFPAKYRIGVSDSEKRADGKDFLIYDAFGEVAEDVSVEELVAKNRILDVAIRVVPTGWAPQGLQPGEFVNREDPTELFNSLALDQKRTQTAVLSASEYVKQGHQVLVFSRRREHCREIAKWLRTYGIHTVVLLGGDDASFRSGLQSMRSGEAKVGVGTIDVIGTGIDLPAVSRGVVAMPVAGHKGMMRQVRGRLCRAAEGKDAELTYLWDERAFPEHLNALSKLSSNVLVSFEGEWLPPSEYRKRSRAKSLAELTAESQKFGGYE